MTCEPSTPPLGGRAHGAAHYGTGGGLAGGDLKLFGLTVGVTGSVLLTVIWNCWSMELPRASVLCRTTV